MGQAFFDVQYVIFASDENRFRTENAETVILDLFFILPEEQSASLLNRKIHGFE